MGLKTGKENEGLPKTNEDLLFEKLAEQEKLIKSLLEAQKVPQSANGMNSDDIVKIIKAATDAAKKEVNYNEAIYEEQIPPEDFDEKGVRFCVPSAGYLIVDDIRKGHRVKLPYGKPYIFFEHAATRKVQQGKYEGVAPYSVYTSHSKKEIDWIRTHSLYGMFYETSTQAAHADAAKATKLAKIMNLLKNYEHPDIIKLCKQHNVPPSEDQSIMRGHLAFKILEVELESEKNSTSKALEETYKHTLIKNNDSLSK